MILVRKLQILFFYIAVVSFLMFGLVHADNQDSLSLKRAIDAMQFNPGLDSTFNKTAKIIDQSCGGHFGGYRIILPLSSITYPNPFSQTNKHLIRINEKSHVRLVLADEDCNVEYSIDLEELPQGSSVYHSPSEILFKRPPRELYLNLLLNDRNIARDLVLFFDVLSEVVDKEKEIKIYPNCTLVQVPTETELGEDIYDFEFDITDDSKPYSILEILDSQFHLVRVLFAMHLDKSKYGVIFNRIDRKAEPLTEDEYYLKLKILNVEKLVKIRFID